MGKSISPIAQKTKNLTWNFCFIKRSYFCVLHPLFGARIKFANLLENQTTLLCIHPYIYGWVDAQTHILSVRMSQISPKKFDPDPQNLSHAVPYFVQFQLVCVFNKFLGEGVRSKQVTGVKPSTHSSQKRHKLCPEFIFD